MKEKISRNKISGHYKSFFGLENMGLGENDNLMIDWGESLVNDFCNQEVEKRIKERIPKPKEAKEKRDNRSGNYLNPRSAMSFDSGFDYAYKWILSCLTCSEKPNNSQKTEGGEG